MQGDKILYQNASLFSLCSGYWLDPDKNAKSPKCFANFYKLPEVTRQKEGYF